MLEYCIREDLKLKKARMMAILDPVKLVIDNYPEGQTELLEVPNNLENPELGSRMVPFGRELYIEREDFKMCIRDRSLLEERKPVYLRVRRKPYSPGGEWFCDSRCRKRG